MHLLPKSYPKIELQNILKIFNFVKTILFEKPTGKDWSTFLVNEKRRWDQTLQIYLCTVHSVVIRKHRWVFKASALIVIL